MEQVRSFHRASVAEERFGGKKIEKDISECFKIPGDSLAKKCDEESNDN